MGKPSGPELQLKKWLWTCLTWPASQFYPGFQWARLIQTYRTTCGLWLEHSAHWAIGSITWATLSPSGQFGSPSIQRWQTIADHLPCTARIISRTGYVKYITALRLSALWVRQSSNARGAPSFLQMMKINGAVTKHIQKQIDAKTTWRTLVRISVSRSDEEWAHPRSSHLTNWSTVAGLGIHCPCFQAKERCEIYLTWWKNMKKATPTDEDPGLLTVDICKGTMPLQFATLKLTINHLVGWALARLLEWWGWNNAVYKHRHVATSGWSYFEKGNPFARNCQTEKHMRQNHPKPSQTYNSCKTVSAWHISIPRCSGYFKGTPGSTKQLVSHGASLASRPMSDWRAGAYSSRIRNQIMRISNHQRHYMSLLSTQWI